MKFQTIALIVLTLCLVFDFVLYYIGGVTLIVLSFGKFKAFNEGKERNSKLLGKKLISFELLELAGGIIVVILMTIIVLNT